MLNFAKARAAITTAQGLIYIKQWVKANLELLYKLYIKSLITLLIYWPRGTNFFPGIISNTCLNLEAYKITLVFSDRVGEEYNTDRLIGGKAALAVLAEIQPYI